MKLSRERNRKNLKTEKFGRNEVEPRKEQEKFKNRKFGRFDRIINRFDQIIGRFFQKIRSF
jgi:hypothetical protein